jgi:hypothetical protein
VAKCGGSAATTTCQVVVVPIDIDPKKMNAGAFRRMVRGVRDHTSE